MALLINFNGRFSYVQLSSILKQNFFVGKHNNLCQNSPKRNKKSHKYQLALKLVYLLLLTKFYADIYTFSIKVKGRFKEKFKFSNLFDSHLNVRRFIYYNLFFSSTITTIWLYLVIIFSLMKSNFFVGLFTSLTRLG